MIIISAINTMTITITMTTTTTAMTMMRARTFITKDVESHARIFIGFIVQQSTESETVKVVKFNNLLSGRSQVYTGECPQIKGFPTSTLVSNLTC